MKKVLLVLVLLVSVSFFPSCTEQSLDTGNNNEQTTLQASDKDEEPDPSAD